MPKLKTNRSAAKRFKKTSNGGVLFKHPNLRHILTKKNRKRKRFLRSIGLLEEAIAKKVRKLIPYK